MTRKARAITFDFWNTLYSADGGAMDVVRPRRIAALGALLEIAGIRHTPGELDSAYRSGFDAYMAAWNRGEHFGAREQVIHVFGVFRRAASGEVGPGETVGEQISDLVSHEAVEQTVRELEDLSLLTPIQLLPGAREAIPMLAEAGYKLGIISDTSLTPGRLLKQFLEADGLLAHFSALTFSDVTGFTKPDSRMFQITLGQLGADPTEAAHVGDTPRTDIAGAKAIGMVTIRCAGSVDHEEPPAADFVIRDHREIPGLLGPGL